MKNKFYLVLKIAILLVQYSIFAQNCTYSIKGYVKDEGTEEPMIGASITIQGTVNGTISDDEGYFEIHNICKGNHHIIISHIGCEDQNRAFYIDGDKDINIVMPHFVDMLDGVHVLGKQKEATTQLVQVVSLKNIQKNANKNLANQLENLTGVSVIKNGNSIAKPVVHGLYGSRVMVLNNNIVQSGQQWGNDHAPEIDPLMAGSIEVVKGVAALEYQGSGLGAVVNVKPPAIKNDPHLHGNILYFSESNGLGNNLNASLEQKNKLFAWRATGTLKKYGDRETPDYLLNNTGYTEANLALQLEKDFSDKFHSDLYISTFNTTLGVLRGSHVTLSTEKDEDGNLSPYALAVLYAEVPQYTEDQFSYDIDAPKQQVNHHLLKSKNTYTINDDEKYVFTYAGQINNRKEFDIRRSGRSNIPALSLLQQTHFIEAKHHKYKEDKDLDIKKGIQYTFTDNTNDSDTGILPLIPDYLSHQVGVFVLLQKDVNDFKFELGGRYNFTYQNVAYIERNTSRSIERYNNYFNNYSLIGGTSYHTSKDFHWSFNVGYTSRNPDVNELYSYGLHQGVSGFERGDSTLQKEVGLKTTLGLEGNIGHKWFFETLAYLQFFEDFIYLQPQDDFITTIRGTFPLYDYMQHDARIAGFDFGTNYMFSDTFRMGAKYSFLKGDNLSLSVPLVYMPANNAQLTAEFNGFKKGFFKNTILGAQYKYVFKQNHLEDWQDLLPAPEAYALLNLNFDTEFYVDKIKINGHIKIANALDTSYRDYLDRLRYFADDLGRTVVIGFRIHL